MQKILIISLFALCSLSLQANKTTIFSPLGDTIPQKENPFQRKQGKEFTMAQLETDALFIDAVKEIELGNVDPAIKLLEQVISRDSNYSAAYYELSTLYFVKSQVQLALKSNLKAAELDPSNDWYLIQLAGMYQQLAQHKKACEIYQTLAERNPSQQEYYDEWAKALLLAKQEKEAVKVFNKWEKRVGINEETSLKKQQIWLACGKPKKATKEIQKLAKAFPAEKRYKAILAEMYMQQKKYNKARKVYLQIKKEDPLDKYIDISLAELYKKKKDNKKAYESLKSGFQNPYLEEDTKLQVLVAFYSIEDFYKNQVDYTFDLTQTLASLYPENPKLLPIYGDFLYRKEKYPEALSVLQKSIQLDSSHYETWEVLLFCEMQMDNGALLKTDIQRVLNLFPAQPFPYYIYANYLTSKNQCNEALEYYQKGVRWVLGNTEVLTLFYSGMADCYFKQKNFAKSDEYMLKTLTLNPDNYIVMNNYAYYLAERNTNLSEAEKISKKTLVAEPKNPTFLDTYAWVLYKSKRYKDALDYIEKACEIEKTPSGILWEHHGDIHYAMGEKAKAKEAWQKAEKAGGVSPELKGKLQQISAELK